MFFAGLALHIRVSLLFLASAGALPAQTPTPSPANPESPTISVVTRIVQLDVIAKDNKGRSVRGLKKEDFTVLEDGVPQFITSFEEHSWVSTVLPRPLRLPPNTFSNVVQAIAPDATPTVILMAAPSMATGPMYVHEEVLSYMKSAPPGTPMALILIRGGMHLLQGFTTDPGILIAAMKSRRTMPSLGGPYDLHPYYFLDQDMLSKGLLGLARYLAGIPGRKNLICFTGFDQSAVGPIFSDSASFVDEMTRSVDVLRLSRVSVYVIDSWGVTSYLHAYQGDDYDQLSRSTGGKSFYSTNGIKEAIREVVNSGSNYYTISYTPSSESWNGSFRRLTIHTRGPQMHLEYRNGYFAQDREAIERSHLAEARLKRENRNFKPAVETEVRPSPGLLRRNAPIDKLHSAMVLGSLPSTELLFVAKIEASADTQKISRKATLPADNYLRSPFADRRTRDYEIQFAAKIGDIHLSQTPDGIRHGKVDFVTVVYADGGEVVNSLGSSETLDLSDTLYRHFQQSGLSMVQHIAIPVKGNYFLRLGIRDAADGYVGAMEIPVDQVKRNR
jgi:VWFA-related protein